jgi:hypothetical protein
MMSIDADVVSMSFKLGLVPFSSFENGLGMPRWVWKECL